MKHLDEVALRNAYPALGLLAAAVKQRELVEDEGEDAGEGTDEDRDDERDSPSQADSVAA